ncbi:unnamed protein product [Paramecium sonneborni]|uniref:Uncharacterized protein n=1 Tax=Paramecium sonneborni TaxID=65129 RepID=A0A8S1R0P8_9CILI|nr:unnamed protein product [Paramecium sonneborni]
MLLQVLKAEMAIYTPLTKAAGNSLATAQGSQNYPTAVGVNLFNKIESTLKHQLFLSTVALSPIIIGFTYLCLPSNMVPVDKSIQLAQLKPWNAIL